jgi:hypothetical protein
MKAEKRDLAVMAVLGMILLGGVALIRNVSAAVAETRGGEHDAVTQESITDRINRWWDERQMAVITKTIEQDQALTRACLEAQRSPAARAVMTTWFVDHPDVYVPDACRF